MDAAKGQYIRFLPEALRLLSEGGVLFSDNVLQDGDVLESRFAVTRRNRTIHARMREYLYVLKHTECPAVLTENMFMDNKADTDWLLSEDGKHALARLHVEGIIKYIESV
jgi:predicted O-methyltransferase YrrM